ncbi:AraC family transcriptional regulator [uncultured Psychroserpens sp.]|uniref:helix-turn-helix domain-containing protein n=1 Tax=uncultured Psychroserpens sp. TaxID=255436 RepID=UPI002628E47F|nr:AraC family transcriptional regulator [uncultured Psychroserpens sp.]
MNLVVALTMFSGIAVSSCLFMSIYFFFVRKENKFLDITIGLIFFSMAMRISKSMLIYLVNGMSLTQISIVLLGYTIAAPLLLLHFKYLFSESKKFKVYNLVHFLGPIVLFLILITDSYRANDVYIWGNYFFLIYLIYIGVKYIFNSKYKSKLTKWHHYLYYGMFGLIIAFSIQNFSRGQTNYTIGLIIASTIIYVLFFVALNSPSVIKKKYSAKVTHELIENIKIALERDKMYLQSGISIAQLSKTLDSPEYLVSKAINAVYGKNFKDVINGFRIADVKTKLINPNFLNEKIENLAFDVGFNTSSAFYSAFKKETSMSPRSYQKSHQKFE